MTLLRTDTLRTWHYCARTHCTHVIIAHVHIAHMTLLRTYTLHTWYYCAHEKKIVFSLCTQNIIVHI